MKKKRLKLVILLLCGAMVASAQTTINGTVTDKSGNPIPGAKVEIPGTDESVLTDLDGTFSLSTSSSLTVVNVYYVGMLPKKQTIVPDMLIKLSKMTWWNKKPEEWQLFVAAEGAFPEKSMKNPAYGISVGYIKEYGVYMKALFSSTPSTSHEWDDFTALKPWTRGAYKSGTQAYVVGGMVRLGCPFYLNLGMGYMNRIVAWELSDGSWAKYNEDCYSGLCIDAGLTLRVGDHFMINGGILAGTKTAKAPYIGIGYSF